MNKLDKIIQISKNRGFVFPAAEIYGGLKGFYDFGHLGVLLKNKIKKLWLQSVVFKRDDIFLIESSLIGPKKIYEASGHLNNFQDPLVECKQCHQRFRNDHLLKGEYGKIEIKNNKPLCPLCKGQLTEEKQFNLMFKTFAGPVENSAAEVYLRPETAQGIFYNFKHYLNFTRTKLPFGIAQIGKSFRNEITPKNFIFRVREFEQMELEFFTKPKESKQWFNFWVAERYKWFLKLGFNQKNIRQRKYNKKELAHYSTATIDIEYKFPWGWDEVEGIANRTDYDLKNHSQYSQEDLSYFDQTTKKKIIPYVIEPSLGVERLMLAILLEFYNEDTVKEETRNIFKFPPFLAPIEVAVLPLLSNKQNLIKKSQSIYYDIKQNFQAVYDENGSIGKRYRRQDEIGTPFCLTIDFQTLKDDTITVRDRDTTYQERIKINEIKDYLKQKIEINI
ncbi:MAG: glycine--tRNA ligase [Candidatus Parcubacteria bacterium]|nr:MAG: glycine--tRNA ligase [Candidatus Parcubacteria bacterium]